MIQMSNATTTPLYLPLCYIFGYTTPALCLRGNLTYPPKLNIFICFVCGRMLKCGPAQLDSRISDQVHSCTYMRARTLIGMSENFYSAIVDLLRSPQLPVSCVDEQMRGKGSSIPIIIVSLTKPGLNQGGDNV